MTEVTVRTDPAHTAAAVRGTIPTYASEGMLWQRLMAGLEGAGAGAVPVPRGSFDGMGAALAALGSWIADHDYRITDPMFDVYVVGPREDHDPAAWVTEVCLPVAPA